MPKRGKLAVITALFNPAGYKRIVSNMKQFVEGINADVFVAEMSFGGAPFEMPSSIAKVRIKGEERHMMWQKERLLNLALEQIPAEYTDIAWIDGDVIFRNANWLADTQRALEGSAIVQLFRVVHRLDVTGTVCFSQPGMVSVIREKQIQRPEQAEGSSGFAWAARREVLEHIRFLDTEVIGGADLLMLAAFFGYFDPASLGLDLNARWNQCVCAWGRRAHDRVRGAVTSIPGEIEHLYHGQLTSRNYPERRGWLSEHAFDPEHDIQLDNSGAWAWATEKKLMHEKVKAYFHSRQEDN